MSEQQVIATQDNRQVYQLLSELFRQDKEFQIMITTVPGTKKAIPEYTSEGLIAVPVPKPVLFMRWC